MLQTWTSEENAAGFPHVPFRVPERLHVHGKIAAFAFRSVLFRAFAGSGKRIMDLTLALALLVACCPFVALLACWHAIREGTYSRLWRRTSRFGKRNRRFDELTLNFAGTSALVRCAARWPVLWNILRGEMSFVGPRPASADRGLDRGISKRTRGELRPGLVCLWWLRQRASIDFDSEFAADCEYLESHSLPGDVAILLRAIVAFFIGSSEIGGDREIRIAGLSIANLDMRDALDTIDGMLAGERPAQICFLNAHCVNLACEEPEYRRVLDCSDLNLVDGIGMKIAARLQSTSFRQNVNGTDLFPRLCERLSGTGNAIYFLGGQPGVAAAVAGWVRKQYPDVSIAGFRDGYFAREEESLVVREIALSGAGLLLVALGVPRQDLWIRRHLQMTGARVAMGVGGLFDFYSGRIPRAPQWVREIGMEWFYRFYQEPRRLFRRYFLGNIVFLSRIMLEKVRQNA